MTENSLDANEIIIVWQQHCNDSSIVNQSDFFLKNLAF